MSFTIAHLKRGQKGIIKEFTIDEVPLNYLKWAVFPGMRWSWSKQHPFSDPLYLNINGCHLAIRKETALLIEIDLM
jgi:ferrous iron transport protein A